MPRSALHDMLEQRKEEILSRWSARVRQMPAAKRLSEEHLRDSLPRLLDRIARAAEPRPMAPLDPQDLSRAHARERLEHGYGVDELLVDYVTLRDAVLEMLEGSGATFTLDELLLFDRTIDAALVDTARYFIDASQRRLRAFDRITTEMVGTNDVEALLDRLVGILIDTVPSVDTAAVLLAEGDRLVVRATQGLEREKERGFTLRFGEGFSGTIAATRTPLFLPDASKSEIIKSEALRTRGVRALYGVPLVVHDEVVGVAHMGSCAAYEFSDEDMLLLGGLATRAAWAVSQAQLVARLEEAARFREQLVGIVGHDLRTPLNALVLGTASLLRTPELPEAGNRVAVRMARSADRMRRMIDQLLDFTRARLGGGLALERRTARLEEICRDAVQELEMAYPERTFVLHARGDTEGAWDADRLKQLVANLVENAVVHGAEAPVSVDVDGLADRVELAVHNEGPPIPADRVATLFEPFRQATPNRRGLGLGLFVAAEVARAHGGGIDVRSSTESGTTFTVALPRSTAST